VSNEVVAHNPLPELISDGSISPETVETIRQDTIYAMESVTEPIVAKPADTTPKIGESSQHDMDALVANVLAKMSPEMLQAVTREILKPVVAAMIRDEINAKKSLFPALIVCFSSFSVRRYMKRALIYCGGFLLLFVSSVVIFGTFGEVVKSQGFAKRSVFANCSFPRSNPQRGGTENTPRWSISAGLKASQFLN
jgi:predicted transcriptional regulator